jgi:hypothetical protein
MTLVRNILTGLSQFYTSVLENHFDVLDLSRPNIDLALVSDHSHESMPHR